MDMENQVLKNFEQITINTTNIAMILKMGYILLAGVAANIFVAVTNLMKTHSNGRKGVKNEDD